MTGLVRFLGTEFLVRSASSDDAPALVAMGVEHAHYERADYDTTGTAERIAQALLPASATTRARLLAWLAEADGREVGYATAALEFSTWEAREYLHMDCLFVREAMRGLGIGAALMAAVVERARELGVDAIEWQTPDWNHDAARFYRRSGAKERGKLRYRLRVR